MTTVPWGHTAKFAGTPELWAKYETVDRACGVWRTEDEVRLRQNERAREGSDTYPRDSPLPSPRVCDDPRRHLACKRPRMATGIVSSRVALCRSRIPTRVVDDGTPNKMIRVTPRDSPAAPCESGQWRPRTSAYWDASDTLSSHTWPVAPARLNSTPAFGSAAFIGTVTRKCCQLVVRFSTWSAWSA